MCKTETFTNILECVIQETEIDASAILSDNRTAEAPDDNMIRSCYRKAVEKLCDPDRKYF